mgnify:CR=1 FL=1
MLDEKYVVDCPACGRVEGYLAGPTRLGNDPNEPDDAENVIDSEVFEGVHGPISRVRCPKCGAWVPPDCVWPA